MRDLRNQDPSIKIKDRKNKISSFLSNLERIEDYEILKAIPSCPQDYPMVRDGWVFPKISKIRINGQYHAFSYRLTTHSRWGDVKKYNDSEYQFLGNVESIIPVVFKSLEFAFIYFFSKSLKKFHSLVSKSLEKKKEVEKEVKLSNLEEGTASYEATYYDIPLVTYLRQALRGYYTNSISFEELAESCQCYSSEEKRALKEALEEEELEIN